MTQYQIMSVTPEGRYHTSIAAPLEMGEVLRDALQLRDTDHTHIVLINLDTGVAARLEQFMRDNASAPDAQCH